MEYTPPPTEKGVRQSEEILEAALRCLARDGFAATSLSRVAAEANVSKRMVLYYFESRAELLDRLGERISERILAQVKESLAGLTDPNMIVSTGFDRIWAAITADRGLLLALFGMTIEGVTDDAIGDTIGDFKEGFRDLLRKQVKAARDQGRQVVVDDEVAVTLTLTGFMGLALEWLEHGDSPTLEKSIKAYKAAIVALAPMA
ncbi:MAG: TetR/AcrR family transcriptional regulator [Solirubrobacterales bacterium]